MDLVVDRQVVMWYGIRGTGSGVARAVPLVPGVAANETAYLEGGEIMNADRTTSGIVVW